MSSDEERDENKNPKIDNINLNSNKNIENDNKNKKTKFPLDRVELKDNNIINTIKPNQNENLKVKR